jgi:hypothetical protein
MINVRIQEKNLTRLQPVCFSRILAQSILHGRYFHVIAANGTTDLPSSRSVEGTIEPGARRRSCAGAIARVFLGLNLQRSIHHRFYTHATKLKSGAPNRISC